MILKWDNSIPKKLMEFLSHSREPIVREALGCFSNICAGSIQLADHVVGNAKLLNTILKLSDKLND